MTLRAFNCLSRDGWGAAKVNELDDEKLLKFVHFSGLKNNTKAFSGEIWKRLTLIQSCCDTSHRRMACAMNFNFSWYRFKAETQKNCCQIWKVVLFVIDVNHLTKLFQLAYVIFTADFLVLRRGKSKKNHNQTFWHIQHFSYRSFNVVQIFSLQFYFKRFFWNTKQFIIIFFNSFL